MHRIGFVVFPGFSAMGLAMLSVFEVANKAAGTAHYALELISETGGPVETSGGFFVDSAPFGAGGFDTVIVGASMEARPAGPALLDFLRGAARSARRIAGPCMGAFSLAEAGLLDGRRATTHWTRARELQERFPGIAVDADRIYTIDGPIWTSAGMSAGIDLALAMIEEDLGEAIALSVARTMVLHHRRAGGQSQFSTMLDLDAKSDRIQDALTHASAHLGNRLSVEELAGAARLSPRQFSRAFHAETGQSPAKAIERLRVEAARVMIEKGRLSMDEIARETGFGDRERMRRAFMRTLGVPPRGVRHHARGAMR
jgi:transcriptional regulator GlxA family with amidase domain